MKLCCAYACGARMRACASSVYACVYVRVRTILARCVKSQTDVRVFAANANTCDLGISESHI